MGAQPEPDRLAEWRARLEKQLQPHPGSDELVSLSLTRVCAMARDELGLSGAALTVMTDDGAQAVAASSDRRSRALEQVGFALGEGPAREAFLYGRPVLVPDLDQAFSRWPGWAPEAAKIGVGAAYAFPVQLGAVRFGVLTAHAEKPRDLNTPEVRRCLVLAEIATDLLLTSSTNGSQSRPDPALQQALHLRSEIYQAQGMVMVALEVSLAEALTRMRAHAYSTGRDLTEVALAIIGGSLVLPQDNGDTLRPPEEEAP